MKAIESQGGDQVPGEEWAGLMGPGGDGSIEPVPERHRSSLSSATPLYKSPDRLQRASFTAADVAVASAWDAARESGPIKTEWAQSTGDLLQYS